MLWMQIKAVVVDINGEPRIIFVASRDIDVGDELLLDYNDRETRCEFIKQIKSKSNRTIL